MSLNDPRATANPELSEDDFEELVVYLDGEECTESVIPYLSLG